MPVTFKTLPTPGGAATALKVTPLSDTLRDMLAKSGFTVPATAAIAVGATTSHISLDTGVVLTLPFGAAHLMNKSPAVPATLSTARTAFGGSAIPEADYPNVFPEDAAWIDALCKELFPVTLPLAKAEKMYQPVSGTSNSSVYRVAFIGPDLRGACRIVGNGVSFRFTTPANLAPEGDVRRVLTALGVNKVAKDRITTHAACTDTYEAKPEEYRMLFGAYYAALRPYITSGFPAVEPFMQNVA